MWAERVAVPQPWPDGPKVQRPRFVLDPSPPREELGCEAPPVDNAPPVGSGAAAAAASAAAAAGAPAAPADAGTTETTETALGEQTAACVVSAGAQTASAAGRGARASDENGAAAAAEAAAAAAEAAAAAHAAEVASLKSDRKLLKQHCKEALLQKAAADEARAAAEAQLAHAQAAGEARLAAAEAERDALAKQLGHAQVTLAAQSTTLLTQKKPRAHARHNERSLQQWPLTHRLCASPSSVFCFRRSWPTPSNPFWPRRRFSNKLRLRPNQTALSVARSPCVSLL
jgi:hypothetical protein